MTRLSQLSAEIIAAICDRVHPADLVPFARTCKAVYSCAETALHRHQSYHERLHIFHDRHPLIVLENLREIIAEPNLAWHIRELEFWVQRKDFSDWRSTIFYHTNPYDFDDPEFLNWPEAYQDHRYLGDEGRDPLYTQDELDYYRSLLSELLQLDEPDTAHWLNRLATGSDEPLKAILIALSPNLRRLVFLQYNLDGPGATDPLGLLSLAIRQINKSVLTGIEWPCFTALHTVVVGAYTELRHPHDCYTAKPQDVAPLFLLPALRKLRLNVIGYENETPPYTFEFGTGVSTCTDLVLYCCEIADETAASFILACKSLERLSWNIGISDEAKTLSGRLGMRLEVETYAADNYDLLHTEPIIPPDPEGPRTSS